jgi:murein L,D-transpeptidase YafK
MKRWIVGLLIIITGLVVYHQYPEAKLPNKKIDQLVVWKSNGIMEAYADGKIIKTYNVSIGQNPEGDKIEEGDKRTPEGTYFINDKNPKSQYHKNLGISYPNAADIREATERNVKPGGEIKIHGLKNGLGLIGKFHRIFNWTAGCVAVTNEEIDELYDHVAVGTPIKINK